MAYVLSHEAHVWQFTQNLSLLPFYPGTSRGGRPFSVDQYTYGEAVRSVMKRQVEVVYATINERTRERERVLSSESGYFCVPGPLPNSELSGS